MWFGDTWWRCERCNLAHYGGAEPGECSVCGGNHFVKVILVGEEGCHGEAGSIQGRARDDLREAGKKGGEIVEEKYRTTFYTQIG